MSRKYFFIFFMLYALTCCKENSSSSNGEAVSKKDLAGRAQNHLVFSEQQTPYVFLTHKILPYFEKAQKKVVIDTNSSLRFYNTLSRLGKKNIQRKLGYKESVLESLREDVAHLRGEYDLSQPIFSFEFQSLEKKQLSDIAVRELSRFVFYDKNIHLKVQLENTNGNMLFFPISNHNLRAYSGIDETNYEDKTYRQLCSDLSKNPNLFLHRDLIEIFGRGFSSSNHNYNEAKLRLLLDIMAIYIAEYYKPLRLKHNRVYNPYMSGSSLLSVILMKNFLDNKGDIIHRVYKDDNSECLGNTQYVSPEQGKHDYCIRKASFTFFQCASYRKKYSIRRGNERLMSAFLKNKNPDLYNKLDTELAAYGEDLIQRFSYTIEDTGEVSSQTIDNFTGFLTFLDTNNSEYGKFLQDRINDNSYPDYFSE